MYRPIVSDVYGQLSRIGKKMSMEPYARNYADVRFDNMYGLRIIDSFNGI